MYNVLCMGVLSSSLSATTCPGPANNAGSAAPACCAWIWIVLDRRSPFGGYQPLPFPVISARSCVVLWCGSEPHLEPTNDLSVCLLEHAPVLVQIVLIYSSIYTCGLSLYAKAQACLFLSVPSTHYLPNLRVSFGTLFFQPLWYVYYL